MHHVLHPSKDSGQLGQIYVVHAVGMVRVVFVVYVIIMVNVLLQIHNSFLGIDIPEPNVMYAVNEN